MPIYTNPLVLVLRFVSANLSAGVLNSACLTTTLFHMLDLFCLILLITALASVLFTPQTWSLTAVNNII